MAHQWIRANLAAALFPLVTELWGRSVVVAGQDENFERTLVSPVDQGKDKGIPQAYYMHNCMPTSQGYQSISYDTLVTGLLDAPAPFDRCFPLQNSDLSRYLFVPAGGVNYIYTDSLGEWTPTSSFPGGDVSFDALVTTAFVQGQSYIYYYQRGCFKYDVASESIVNVELVGLGGIINGICAANGYMIAFSDTAVAWSNAANPLDFVPSIITGAGGGNIGPAKGRIIAGLPISGGFILYCERNAVAAAYSGNINFPFIFTEIKGSGGIASPDQVSFQSNSDTHYVWSSAGIQAITLTSASSIFPEVSDFLSGNIYEDFDESSNLFTTTYPVDELYVKVTFVSEQYVVFSYGVLPDTYTYALVFDINLQRWGKLKIDHVDCFTWNEPKLFGFISYGDLEPLRYTDIPVTVMYDDLVSELPLFRDVRKDFAFLQLDGTVQVVDFQLDEESADGVLLLGKFQLQRNRFITHQQTDVETVQASGAFEMRLYSTIDGKTFSPAAGISTFAARTSPKARRFNRMYTGQNYSLLFKGAFELSSVITNMNLAGNR